VQVAQRSLEFFAVGRARRRKQRLHQCDEVSVREWFFQEMNRAEARGLFLMDGEMAASQDDGPRVRVLVRKIVRNSWLRSGTASISRTKRSGFALRMMPWPVRESARRRSPLSARLR